MFLISILPHGQNPTCRSHCQPRAAPLRAAQLTRTPHAAPTPATANAGTSCPSPETAAQALAPPSRAASAGPRALPPPPRRGHLRGLCAPFPPPAGPPRRRRRHAPWLRLPWWAPHRQAEELGPAAPPAGRPASEKDGRGSGVPGSRGLSWRRRRRPSRRRRRPGGTAKAEAAGAATAAGRDGPERRPASHPDSGNKQCAGAGDGAARDVALRGGRGFAKEGRATARRRLERGRGRGEEEAEYGRREG